MIEVIGTAAAMTLTGAGYGRISAGLGVAAATVRGWLRRLRCRAGAMRQDTLTSSASSAGCPVRRPPGPAA